MANICMFDMQIAGPPAAVEEFVQMMKWEGKFENDGLGRIYSFECDLASFELDPEGSGMIQGIGFGDCAWSILSAMRERPSGYRSLESETERLGIAIDAYSSEPGIGFQEHVVINKGIVLEDECEDYLECYIPGMEEADLLELCEEQKLTKENLLKRVNDNGDFCVGGFGDYYGDFKDLFEYVRSSRSPSLDAKIEDAKTRQPASQAKDLPEKPLER